MNQGCAKIGFAKIGSWLLAGLVVACSTAARAQDDQQSLSVPLVGTIDADFLLSYYDQDGDHSPVTGGIGTESLSVVAPVFIVRWQKNERWTFGVEAGVDNVTSASTDNIDLGEAEISGASRVDARANAVLSATGRIGAAGKNEVGFTLGLSNEYDYRSLQAGLRWSRSFQQDNATLSASVRRYQDSVDLYGIDGEQRGEDDRTTTDLSLAWTQVLSRRTVGTVELYLSEQSGFLSTPFHEVILAPTTAAPDGLHVAERLPDSRSRMAVGIRLNHAFGKRFTQRFYYRYYDDDWGINASTVELEPWFRVSDNADVWLFPILRYHTQTASDYFGLPGTFTAPRLQTLADRYPTINVIVISVDDDLEGRDRLVHDLGLRVPVLWDEDHQIAEHYQPTGMPATRAIVTTSARAPAREA